MVTAFRITGPEFTGWEGCDCFFNACLMRRGPREFSGNRLTGETRVQWAGKNHVGRTLFDAATSTAVRYFIVMPDYSCKTIRGKR